MVKNYINNRTTRDELAKSFFNMNKAYSSFILNKIALSGNENEIIIEIDKHFLNKDIDITDCKEINLITTIWYDKNSENSLLEFRLYSESVNELKSTSLLIDKNGNVIPNITDSFWDECMWNIAL